ncbi:MAG: response regulator transcription factor [Mycobacteriales bacterium]
MPVLLLVEDDPAIRGSLTRGMTERGHAVHAVASGLEALRIVADVEPDVVLLDLGLPDLDGKRILPMLRAVTEAPVLIITARDDEDEIVALLDAGADDYLVKPFSARQLDARVRAVLRRSTEPAVEGVIEVGGLAIDPASREVRLDGRSVDLTRKEFELLCLLARRAGDVVSKRDILAEVWRLPYGGADKTVDVHLSWLRRKLGESASEPRYLHSVRGVGVRLHPPS